MPTVVSIAPADGSSEVVVGTPIVVRLQRTDSTGETITETSQADFAVGTLADTFAAGSGRLELLRQLVDDFESYATGSLPAEWEAFLGSAPATVESLGGSKVLQIAGSGGATARSVRWLDAGQEADRDVAVKVRATTSAGTLLAVNARITGDTTYYWADIIDGTTVRLGKTVASASTTLDDAAFTWSADTWYWIRLQVVGTAIRAKVWAASGSEPSTWTLEVTDSDITAAGYVGVRGSYTTGTTWYFDDVTLYGEGSEYAASGSRISPEHDISAVGVVGRATIEFDATAPTDTTLVVKTRIDGGAWSDPCTSGQAIEGLTEGTDVSASVIEVQAELATSDTAVTPHLSELRLIFRPQDPALVEISVGAAVFSIAAGTLSYWNDSRIVGGELVTDETDLYYTTEVRWYAGEGAALTVAVSYDGVELDTAEITVEALGEWIMRSDGYWVAWESTPEWAIGGADGAFNVLDYAPSLVTADGWYAVQEALSVVSDGWYWVAHAVEFDSPGAAIVGQPTLSDAPAAVVVRGWTRDDSPAAAIVQGWMRADAPGAAIVAQELVSDTPAAAIVGHPLASDAPAAAIVYEAPRLLVLEVQVIDPATAVALAAAGVVVPS